MLYVSASNLDAVDFTAAGLAAAVMPSEVIDVVIDDSLLTGREPTKSEFDPRLAVPLQAFKRSPDGTIRQVMSLPTATSAADFLSKCYRNLGLPNVRVRMRGSRALRRQETSQALSAIYDWIVLTGGTDRVLTQGGAVQRTGGALIRRVGVRDGQLTFFDSLREIRADDLVAEGGELRFRGPLDALAMGASPASLCLHSPWYLPVRELAEWPSGPRALDLVQSLFYRAGDRQVLLGNEFGGVLLDDFSLAWNGGGELAWIPEAARWVSSHITPCHERWAWSQAPARSLTQRLKAQRIQPPPDSPFARLVQLAMDAEALSKRHHDVRSCAQLEVHADELSGAARQILAHWSDLFSKCGLPEDFDNGGFRGGLPGVMGQVRAVEGNNVGRRIAGIRSAVWNAVDLAVRAIMLVADTVFRASIPRLAELASRDVFRTAVERHGDLLRQRMDLVRVLEVV